MQVGDEKIKEKSPLIKSNSGIRLIIENDRHRSLAIAKRSVSWLGDFRSCLFWVCEYGIWPSSENWHLYYRLRSSYGDLRQLIEAPGHLVMDYEKADLVTLVDLAIQFGWGGHVLPTLSKTYMYLSHDGWLHIESETERERILKDIEDLSLPYA